MRHRHVVQAVGSTIGAESRVVAAVTVQEKAWLSRVGGAGTSDCRWASTSPHGLLFGGAGQSGVGSWLRQDCDALLVVWGPSFLPIGCYRESRPRFFSKSSGADRGCDLGFCGDHGVLGSTFMPPECRSGRHVRYRKSSSGCFSIKAAGAGNAAGRAGAARRRKVTMGRVEPTGTCCDGDT